MAFTLRQLQYFVAVAEQGSVTRAAQNLSISQSSITEAIKELEGDLGVSLFERHPRGLSITHNGHQFLRHATKILADVSDARRSFAEPASALKATLNLGVTSLVAGYVLSDLLARYRRACRAWRFPPSRTTAPISNICWSAASWMWRSWSSPTCATAWRCRPKSSRPRPIASGCRSAIPGVGRHHLRRRYRQGAADHADGG